MHIVILLFYFTFIMMFITIAAAVVPWILGLVGIVLIIQMVTRQ